MNLVHTFEFTVISILYLFTIIQTMSLIYGTKEYRRKYVTVFLMYLIYTLLHSVSFERQNILPVYFIEFQSLRSSRMHYPRFALLA